MKVLALALAFIASFASVSHAFVPECKEPASKQSNAEEKEGVDLLNQTYRSILLSELYGKADFIKWYQAASKTEIRFVDDDLPADINGIVQQGTAYSCENLSTGKMFTFINRAQWSRLREQIDRESLIQHEVAVLAGLENTGNYFFTQKFIDARKNSYLARYALDRLTCQLTLFEKTNQNDSNQKPLAQKKIQVESGDQIVQLLGKENRDGVYARILGNSGSITSIGLMRGKPVLVEKNQIRLIQGEDLLRKRELLQDPQKGRDYVLYGDAKNFSGSFSKFFDADPYLFQVTCESLTKQ